MDPAKTHDGIEERDQGRLPWRLFERLLRVVSYPVFVVTLDRELDIEAAQRLAGRHHNMAGYSLLVLNTTRAPKDGAHTPVHSDQTPARRGQS